MRQTERKVTARFGDSPTMRKRVPKRMPWRAGIFDVEL